ncbi:MAG: dissimilatory-type sulfite reductase subunit alpha [Chloroflexota bacterium]|nr:dissimilatory-type sulfite reductase subunit alpha [Chloroflexota bacterium]
MSETPMMDELEKGPWPSFVTQMKRAGESKALLKDASKDLINALEQSYVEKQGLWKHGGIVGVKGYGGGVIGRYHQRPEDYPGLEHFHTMRINHPCGWFYTTDKLREVCDVWDRHGSGLTNFHGSTGDIIFLGTTTPELQPIADDLSEHGWDLGSSGSALRTPTGCVGPARCEFACFDTLDFIHDVTMEYQNEMHRPPFPYKTKIKASGCCNDCVAAMGRADHSVIGTWRDELRIDNDAVKEYIDSGMDVFNLVVHRCPTHCLELVNGKLELARPEDCVRCMHCINMMPKAVRPGLDKGATILVGAKAPVLHGAVLSTVLFPFMKMESPYTEFKEYWEKAIDWWDENGKVRERLAELIDRVGMGEFLKAMDIEAVPQMVNTPRANPYIFWRHDTPPGLDEFQKFVR